MRSSVADSRGEVSTEEIRLDVAMTMVMRTKETLGVDTVLLEHVCQAESGCVMSCNFAAGATEV